MSKPNATTNKPSYLQKSEILRNNERQWQAYESKGNCIILAGPGSGKTKTLTLKMARMLAEDVKPPRGIACITYSNQCARELRSRLGELGVEDGRRASIGTLHSFCLQHIILPYAKIAGLKLPDPLKVASKQECAASWKQAVNIAQGDDSGLSNWVRRCEAYRRVNLDRDTLTWQDNDPDAAQIIKLYERNLRKGGAIDFEMMARIGLKLVEIHEWIRKAIRARFPILVVDEYQDLGLALHRMVQCLVFQAGLRLIAVGDPDQSIYGFNGAKPTLLESLANHRGLATVRLQLNYRCGPTIIQASKAVLSEDRDFIPMTKEPGTIDFHYRPEGLQDQSEHICSQIVSNALARRRGRKIGDIAILYRSKDEGDFIAQAVRNRGWDFIRFDQGNPYARTPVMYWLEDCAAWCAGGWQSGKPSLGEIVRSWLRFNESITTDSGRRLLKIQLIKFLFSNRSNAKTVHAWLSECMKVCLASCLNREPRMAEDAVAVDELMHVCGPGKLLATMTIAGFGRPGGSGTHLNLMTLHSAKGLEFDVVIMMGLEEGKVPDFRSNSLAQMREDRRLFYVGLTRARHEVHLVYSGWYINHNRRFQNGPSRFIQEVQSSLSKTL